MLKNKKILITCGPTWVPIDDMRVISNKSTGTLGKILAKDCSVAKAKVTFLEGPVEHPLNLKTVVVRKFVYYQEFVDLLNRCLKDKYDIVIHAAAVSDYQLKKIFKTKLSSDQKELNLHLVSTEKLISSIKNKAPQSFLIGFKLESTVQKKVLLSKANKLFKTAQCDLVIANSLKNGYCGYILEKGNKILKTVYSREELSKELIKTIREKI